MPSHRQVSSNSKRSRPQKNKGSARKKSLQTGELFSVMESCKDAESLNERVITPFVQTLVQICDARGYVFNIYGEHCNLAITPENHAEQLYDLINAYLDEAGVG